MESQNTQNNDGNNNYWGTLINPDKSPAPLLEQLCIGLAQLMVKLDAGNGSSDLTPDKLARFYREVGANYDTLFLDTKGPALSFIYQSLGCFHTLQPTTNPFEPPSIPALLPIGFVRWQVINLLLCPDEHAQYLQAALDRWDVPNPCDGGTCFPKVIPRNAFPEAPDKDMVQWHEIVSQKLEREHADQQHSSARRHFPADFVRYYSAATGARKHHHPHFREEEPTFHKDSNNYNTNNYRFRDTSSRAPFDDQPENVRHSRRYFSPDGRPRRRRIFDDGCSDGRPDSRASSRNPSPRQTTSPASAARVPLRTKSMRVRNRESPELTPMSSSHHKHRHPYRNSSDSSNNDDGVFPPRRYGSSDSQQRQAHSSYLSPARGAGLSRRHSHDATSPISKSRDQESDVSYSYKGDRRSSRPKSQRYMAVPRTKFHETMFDDAPRPSRAADQPLQYELNTDVPRVHVKYEGSPLDRRGTRPGTGNSGSSGSERPRSSSNGSGGTGWKSQAAGRRVSAHE